MPLRIITLCENTATFGFKAEWGLSMLVDYNGFTFLMDTGMTDVAIGNAREHNVDFSKIDAIVLSHGHLDHTGGLAGFLKETGPMDIFAHPDVFGRKLSVRRRPPDQDISMPLARADYEGMGASFRLSRNPAEIAPGIITSGEVPMVTDFESIDEGLLVDHSGIPEDDSLADDLSVAVKTEKGLFVFLGCAHRGPVNIIRHFINITGETKVYGVAGGLHLGRADERRVENTVDFFKEVGVKKLACCHCTGFMASAVLEREFENEFIRNNSGKRMFFN